MNQILHSIKNPFEKERTSFRPHGFDNINEIFEFISGLSNQHQNIPFQKEFNNKSRYLFIKSDVNDKNKPNILNIELDVGYIDFQDGTHNSLARIELIYFSDLDRIIVMFAQNEGVVSMDIDDTLLTIKNGGYLNLAEFKN